MFRGRRVGMGVWAKAMHKDARLLSTCAQVVVFGASTDVGKTIISGGLCRAALASAYRVCYLKPVQTGKELDEWFIREYTNPEGERDIYYRTLFQWRSPVSPHIAAAADGNLVSDSDLRKRIQSEVKAFSYSGTGIQPSVSIIETAGGVLSPGIHGGPSSTLQADIYRPLRPPILLVGDTKLGGITSTLCALESLMVRGYTTHAVCMVNQANTLGLGNAELIYKHLGGRIPVYEFSPLPRDQLLHTWFRDNDQEFQKMFQHVLHSISSTRTDMSEMRAEGLSRIWWPFTQHDHVKDSDVTFIESACGDEFRVLDARSEGKHRFEDVFDACASWWTQGVGHGHPSMALAIASAAGRWGHVHFPRNLHPPAVELAQELIQGAGAGWASRVFFSDNGSTAMEVALKMALRAYATTNNLNLDTGPNMENVSLCAIVQDGCYHGDTLGTMDLAPPSIYNKEQHPWYKHRSISLSVPTVRWTKGLLEIDASTLGITIPDTESVGHTRKAVYDVIGRLGSPLALQYRTYVSNMLDKHCTRVEDLHKLTDTDTKVQLAACVVLEPLILGAGGMRFVDPLFQRVLVDVCRERGAQVVYDEIAVGMYRLGHPSPGNAILGTAPDVSTYAKMLTGGYLPLAVTLAADHVFEAFQGDTENALLHGHSYTAHPIGCSAALEALRILRARYTAPHAHPIHTHTYAHTNSRGFAYIDPTHTHTHVDLDSTGLGLGLGVDCWTDDEIMQLSNLPGVKSSMSLGTVIAVELEVNGAVGYGSSASADVISRLRANYILARPLGPVVYIMASSTTAPDRCKDLWKKLQVLTESYYSKRT